MRVKKIRPVSLSHVWLIDAHCTGTQAIYVALSVYLPLLLLYVSSLTVFTIYLFGLPKVRFCQSNSAALFISSKNDVLVGMPSIWVSLD